jgi:hypothetical protein
VIFGGLTGLRTGNGKSNGNDSGRFALWASLLPRQSGSRFRGGFFGGLKPSAPSVNSKSNSNTARARATATQQQEQGQKRLQQQKQKQQQIPQLRFGMTNKGG